MTRRAVLLLAILLALSTLLARQEVERLWRQPLPLPQSGWQLQVAPGEPLRAVLQRLHRDGMLAFPRVVATYARWRGIDQKIRHGEYLLPPGTTIDSLLDRLLRGEVIQYQVTLPEGITLARALDILAAQEAIDPVLDGVQDPRLADISAPYANPEGLFLPETYHFARGTTDLEVLVRAHRDLLSLLEQEWSNRDPDLPYENPYEALILASIIERETGVATERPEIAGVFVRRLQRGMRLQTDPAVMYGLGGEFDGNLRRSHLADDDNPYNTYRHDGLPPTPIALPGREAIHAALHPAQGAALFFVARGDGSHEFSASLAEHEKAVHKYQIRRRADYRSSPEKP